VYTILVVDDDPALLEVVARVLEEPGYTVITVKNGYEAVATLADRHVDLMITDIRMPGLNGLELARQAKLLRPNLHIMYMSGYFSGGDGRGPEYGILLQKPVRADTLLAAIRREISAGPRAAD
jgi:CheY-like chemotaxis protein